MALFFLECKLLSKKTLQTKKMSPKVIIPMLIKIAIRHFEQKMTEFS